MAGRNGGKKGREERAGVLGKKMSNLKGKVKWKTESEIFRTEKIK